MWVYYGYPTSTYEGVNVEQMRYRCGEKLAGRDEVRTDMVAGVPDSGIAHAVGYANRSGIPFARPFIKYTPTWPRSFRPPNQTQRNLIARMKLIPVNACLLYTSLDSWCGRMFPEPSPAAHPRARTSGSSSKKSSELRSVVFQSLDLTPGAWNLLGESYWELISPWRGDASTANYVQLNIICLMYSRK